MLAILFVTVFLTICLVAPFVGVDTSDARAESAHPVQGWFPGMSR